MADFNKSTIVVASVLKPVDDTRMYEKIAGSLACSNRYRVHVIGPGSVTQVNPNLIQHGFKPFRRISLRRLFAPWLILIKTFRLKPDLFIITTHELLYAALLMKLLTRCKIIYDLQENYYWNILYTSAFPLLLKPFVALYVRGKEILSAPYVDHFFLAEKGYETELKFPRANQTVLENKVRVPVAERKEASSIKSKNTIQLIFSGTLAETMGVFTAIDLAVKLHITDERIRLTIIGYCPQSSVLQRIRLLIQPRPFITLIARNTPIPHPEIFEEVKKSDFGLVTYEVNPATMNSIPTKLYEYLGFKLPVLLVNHKPWVEFCHPYSAAIVFDKNSIDSVSLFKEMTEKDFYTAEPAGVYWESEEPKLMRVVSELLGSR
jgi:glycosyltransferase involved in cell wall biosynthesis